MKKLVYITLGLSVLLLASCGKNSSAYKKLERQYDSLQLRSQSSEANLEEMLSIINEVEKSFEEIREAEKFVTVHRKGGELTASTRDEIKSNMLLVAQTLKENRAKLEKLNAQLKDKDAVSHQMSVKIKRLSEEINRKETMLVELQQQLAMKDIHIEKLDSALVQAAQNVDALASENAAKDKALLQQDAKLNTVYYCFGTASELKEHKILSGGGLFSAPKVLPEGFNKEYFIKIDRRELRSIPLFDRKAEVRTKHPAGSYELVKGADNNLTLNILDVENFWSISKYLVVEVR